MGIANEQILSHLSIESIPKSVANGGVTTENEPQSDRLSNHVDYYTAIRGGGGEINEKIGKSLTLNNYSCKVCNVRKYFVRKRKLKEGERVNKNLLRLENVHTRNAISC